MSCTIPSNSGGVSDSVKLDLDELQATVDYDLYTSIVVFPAIAGVFQKTLLDL
jgi:hypothetical protein